MKDRTPEQQLAVSLQRAKTFMETQGFQNRHWTAYNNLSEAIYALEKSAHLDAPTLRDEEDELRRPGVPDVAP